MIVMEATEGQPVASADDRPLARVVCNGMRLAKSTGTRIPCTYVFFFGYLRDATIQVPCPKCQTMNTIDKRPG